MEERKRVLLLGGTGAIGTHVAPELVRRGFSVTVTSRSAHTSDDRRIEYRQGDAKDDAFLDALLAERFDAIVDFMIYTTAAFSARCEKLLSHTDHYVFLSSYRVYGDAGCAPITEESPRLLESVNDPEYLKTDEYGLAKARQEDLLRASGRRNYTIVRPSITYAGDRFQLGTMEANEFLVRALKGKAVIFPKEMLPKRAAMTWAGDVGRMIARLVCSESAYGETYTAASAETQTWNSVLKLYQKILGMQVKQVPLSVYRDVVGRPWQIKYDRMLHRIIDNNKILLATGMKQSELMPLSDGLRIELAKFAAHPQFKNVDEAMQARFDRVIADLEAQSKKASKKDEPPKGGGIKGMLRRVRWYRKRHVLMKVVKKKLYQITPLRKAVHGIKRVFRRS